MVLPSRTANSWTAASLSWRAKPTTSSSVRAKAAIFCDFHRPLDGPDLVPQGRRPLELQPVGGGLHLAPEGLRDRLLAALEEQLDLVDVGAVGGLVDGLDAGALAALDVVQQARPLEGPLALPDVDGAGPEREQAPDEVHRLVHAAGRGVRPEVAAAVVRELAGPLDPREVVAQRDLDERVALVVLEADVEARLVALDEVGLEEQRLADRVGERVLEVGDPVDGRPDAVQLAGAADRLLLPVLRTRLRRLCALPTYSTRPGRPS